MAPALAATFSGGPGTQRLGPLLIPGAISAAAHAAHAAGAAANVGPGLGSLGSIVVGAPGSPPGSPRGGSGSYGACLGAVASPRRGGLGRGLVGSGVGGGGTSPGPGPRREALLTPRHSRTSLASNGVASRATGLQQRAGGPAVTDGRASAASSTSVKSSPGDTYGTITGPRRRSIKGAGKGGANWAAGTQPRTGAHPSAPAAKPAGRGGPFARGSAAAATPSYARNRTSNATAGLVGRPMGRPSLTTPGPGPEQRGASPGPAGGGSDFVAGTAVLAAAARGRIRSPTRAALAGAVEYHGRMSAPRRSLSPGAVSRQLRPTSPGAAPCPPSPCHPSEIRVRSVSPPLRDARGRTLRNAQAVVVVPVVAGPSRAASTLDLRRASSPSRTMSAPYLAGPSRAMSVVSIHHERPASPGAPSSPRGRAMSPSLGSFVRQPPPPQGQASPSAPSSVSVAVLPPRASSPGPYGGSMYLASSSSRGALLPHRSQSGELNVELARSVSPPPRSFSPSLPCLHGHLRTLSPSPSAPRSFVVSAALLGGGAGLLAQQSMPHLGLGVNPLGAPGGFGKLVPSGSGPLFGRGANGLLSPRRFSSGEQPMCSGGCLGPSPGSGLGRPWKDEALSLPPFFYEADSQDAMDVALLQELVALNLEVSARLNIRRVRQGEYDVEGVRASLFWNSEELWVRAKQSGAKRRRRSKSKGRSEEDDGEEDGQDVSLATYLRQLANVDTRERQTDHVDAIAAAAAFAGVTGGVGIAGAFRPHSPAPGCASGSSTPPGPGPRSASPGPLLLHARTLSPAGSVTILPAPSSITLGGGIGLAGQALAALGGHHVAAQPRGRSPSIGALQLVSGSAAAAMQHHQARAPSPGAQALVLRVQAASPQPGARSPSTTMLGPCPGPMLVVVGGGSVGGGSCAGSIATSPGGSLALAVGSPGRAY